MFKKKCKHYLILPPTKFVKHGLFMEEKRDEEVRLNSLARLGYKVVAINPDGSYLLERTLND